LHAWQIACAYGFAVPNIGLQAAAIRVAPCRTHGIYLVTAVWHPPFVPVDEVKAMLDSGMPCTVLAQRRKQLQASRVVHIEAKPNGKRHLYRLTPAAEDFCPIVALMTVKGQRLSQGLIGAGDLDPKMLLLRMRRRINPVGKPVHGFIIRLDLRGHTHG
jgi:hypothetical protein